jgi:hypothetical protein
MYLDLRKSSTSAATDTFAKLAVAFIYSVSPNVEVVWMDVGAGFSPKFGVEHPAHMSNRADTRRRIRVVAFIVSQYHVCALSGTS